jgi:hypothetical protein
MAGNANNALRSYFWLTSPSANYYFGGVDGKLRNNYVEI